MSDWICEEDDEAASDPTRQVFRGITKEWMNDSFVIHMFWTYGGVMDGTDMGEMKEDIEAMLKGGSPKDGFCKDLAQTGSRFYRDGVSDGVLQQSTDFDYFGSPQMVGTWAIYLYLTGWELSASPYHKGVYARYNKSSINLIT